MSNNSNIIKAYKGFNKDMTSIIGNFKYEEGKEYEIKGKLCMCYNGFHTCTNPLEVFFYYEPEYSVYHEVELSGNIIRDNIDSKLCSSKIKIGRRLDPIKDIIEPNLDTDTEIVTVNDKVDENLIIINNKPGDIIINYSGFCKGVIDSYLVLLEIVSLSLNAIALKVDGERIKEDSCYRYKNGKIIEYKK